MAEYLTTSPDALVFVAAIPESSPTILVTPKSQISGSPLPTCGQPVVRG